MIKFLQNTTNIVIRGEKLVLHCSTPNTHHLLNLTYAWKDNTGNTIATGMVYRSDNTQNVYSDNVNRYHCKVTAKYSDVVIEKNSNVQEVTILCM